MRWRAPLLTFAILLIAHEASAQECLLVKKADVQASNIGTSAQVAIAKNAEFLCPGGKRIAAVEIGAVAATGVFTLNSNVRFSDSTKIITGDFGTYNKFTAELEMRGNVVVTDVKTGSRIYTPQLNYYQISKSNKVARGVTSGGRAHVVFKQKPGATTNPKSANDTSIVDADIVEIIGERTFKGTGNAIITRPDMRGYGNYVEYDQDRGDLLLAQAARIEGDKFRLISDTIRAIASEGQQIKEIRALWNSTLTSDQVRVESPFLHIYLDSGAVNRMVATRPTARPGLIVSLPRVISTEFNVSADSIDALAPKQILESVDAIGHAFGEKLDTVPPPEVAKQMPNVLNHDWLRGDTLHAVFMQNPEPKRPANDTSAKNDRVLKQIIALGSSASSAIRMQQPKDSTWRIYYTLADRITVDFMKGTVSNVDLKGNVHGVFLSPLGASTAPAPRKKGKS